MWSHFTHKSREITHIHTDPCYESYIYTDTCTVHFMLPPLLRTWGKKVNCAVRIGLEKKQQTLEYIKNMLLIKYS